MPKACTVFFPKSAPDQSCPKLNWTDPIYAIKTPSMGSEKELPADDLFAVSKH